MKNSMKFYEIQYLEKEDLQKKPNEPGIRSADRNDTAILCLHTLMEPIRGGGRPVTENKVKHLISVTDTHFVLGYF